MDEETKQLWLKLLNTKKSVHAIDIKQKLKLEPLKAISCMLLKVPSLFFKNGIKVKIKTFWGGNMIAIFPDGISSYIAMNEFFEEGLTRMLIEYLKEGMTFIDIGAHIGYFSLLASDIVGSQGQVHSFEPTSSIFSVLKENAQSRKNIVVNNTAVFSRTMELEFKNFGLRYSAFNSFATPKLNKIAKYENIKVNAITLDEYVEKNKITPNFVKIDAENAEFDILKGMEKTINRYMPIISLEVGVEIPGIVSSHDCVSHLIKKGYLPVCYENGKIKKHEIKDEYEYDNIVFLPNNK